MCPPHLCGRSIVDLTKPCAQLPRSLPAPLSPLWSLSSSCPLRLSSPSSPSRLSSPPSPSRLSSPLSSSDPTSTKSPPRTPSIDPPNARPTDPLSAKILPSPPDLPSARERPSPPPSPPSARERPSLLLSPVGPYAFPLANSHNPNNPTLTIRRIADSQADSPALDDYRRRGVADPFPQGFAHRSPGAAGVRRVYGPHHGRFRRLSFGVQLSLGLLSRSPN